jgi:hypothetical protein
MNNLILNPYYVSGLCSFFVLVQFVLYALAFVQSLKSIRLDHGKMDKDVGRNFWVNNEPKTFFLVKPLDCAFSHRIDRTSQPLGPGPLQKTAEI